MRGTVTVSFCYNTGKVWCLCRSCRRVDWYILLAMGTTVGYALRKLSVYLSAVAMIIFAVVQITLLKLLSFVSPGLMRKIHLKMGEKVTMTQNPKFRYEDWGPTFFSLTFIKTVLSVNWCSLGLEAFEGHAAPDTALFTLDGQRTSIRSFHKGNVIVSAFYK